MRADEAIWSQLVAGEGVRTANLDRAAAKLDAYPESMAYLRPIMERHPHLTVAEAVQMMRGSVA